MGLLAPLVTVLAVLVAVPLIRHRAPAGRALALRRAGLGWTAVFAVLASLFTIGETLSDPGGGTALALIAAWVVPMVGLSALAWWRPTAALPVLVVLLVAGLAFSAWDAVSADGGRGGQGPADAVSLFAVSVVPLGVLGWHRPRPAGVLLLLAAVLPTAFIVLGTDVPLSAELGGSTAAATVPGGVTGVLFLLADRFQRREALPSPGPAGRAGGRSADGSPAAPR